MSIEHVLAVSAHALASASVTPDGLITGGIGLLTLIVLILAFAVPLLRSGRKERQGQETKTAEQFVRLDEVVKSNDRVNASLQLYIDRADRRFSGIEKDIVRLQVLAGDAGTPPNGRKPHAGPGE